MRIENPRVDGSIPPLATNYPIENKQKSVIRLRTRAGKLRVPLRCRKAASGSA